MLPDRNDTTLHSVRSLGFDSMFGALSPFAPEKVFVLEKVFFLGPTHADGSREVGAHATEEAVLEFIAHCEHQAQVARDYLANGRNNMIHAWR